jgi:hypothetical protein
MTTTEVPAADQAAVTVLTQRLAACQNTPAKQSLPVPGTNAPSA